jgi:hypothetical protein
MKASWTVAAWLAFAVACLVLVAAGISPKPAPWWLSVAGVALLIYGTKVMSKGREAWTDRGWCFAAVENVVMASILYLVGLALSFAAFFAHATQ